MSRCRSHGLGLRATAEGVEDDVHYELVRNLGCDRAQGVLWAKPAPMADTVERIRVLDRAADQTGDEPMSQERERENFRELN